jgi:hypothetical protein
MPVSVAAPIENRLIPIPETCRTFLMMKTLSFPFIDFNSPFLATFQFNHVAAHATFLDFNAPIQINTARLHLSHRIT